MFGKSSLSKEHAEIIQQIEEGERRAPQHRQPKSIANSGFTFFVTPERETLFNDFCWFGAVVNFMTADPWAIEEMPDTLLKDLDDPDLGRTYRVSYNAALLGRLQIGLGALHNLYPEAFGNKLSARAVLHLDWLRFIPYDDAHQFVSTVELLIGPFEDGNIARTNASAAATAALTGYLWESVRVDDTVMAFDHRADGPYDLLRQTTDHWKANGIDPFERWDGDRPDRS